VSFIAREKASRGPQKLVNTETAFPGALYGIILSQFMNAMEKLEGNSPGEKSTTQKKNLQWFFKNSIITMANARKGGNFKRGEAK